MGDIWIAAHRGSELPNEPQRRSGLDRVCICTPSILHASS